MSASLCLNYTKFKIQSNQIQSNIMKTMIIVCPFYVICWLPSCFSILVYNVDSQ